MPKRMRSMSRKRPTGVYPIERNSPGGHLYYYGPYDPNDKLDTLLADKVNRNVK